MMIKRFVAGATQYAFQRLSIGTSPPSVSTVILTCVALPKFISASIKSPDFEIYMKLAIVVVELFKISEQEDGWIVLDRALHIIRQESPQDIIELRKKFGKKLREIILPTDIFDIKDESTNKGGTRVLYRIKSEFKCIKSNKIKISVIQIENRPTVVDLWIY